MCELSVGRQQRDGRQAGNPTDPRRCTRESRRGTWGFGLRSSLRHLPSPFSLSPPTHPLLPSLSQQSPFEPCLPSSLPSSVPPRRQPHPPQDSSPLVSVLLAPKKLLSLTSPPVASAAQRSDRPSPPSRLRRTTPPSPSPSPPPARSSSCTSFLPSFSPRLVRRSNAGSLVSDPPSLFGQWLPRSVHSHLH